LIVSASSFRQVHAIAQAIDDELAILGIKPLSRLPAHDESGWMAVDIGSIIVHIFYTPTREFYALEKLWSDGKRVRLPRQAVLKS
jgi:ribosome-associated protein